MAIVDVEMVNCRLDERANEYRDHWTLHKRRSHLKFLTAYTLALETGLTPQEILLLKPEQLMSKTRLITIPAAQGLRQIPVPERARSALHQWLIFCSGVRDPIEEYVFGSASNAGAPLDPSRFRLSASEWLDLRHPSEDRLISLFDMHLAFRVRLSNAGMPQKQIKHLTGQQDRDLARPERRVRKRATKRASRR